VSEKFDELNQFAEPLGSEMSEADLPKAKGKLALSVRMLMILALLMIAPQAMAKGKKAKAGKDTAPAGLTSEEAKKHDPWEMDLKKMMEAIPGNFDAGVDPFKEMSDEQPALFMCDDIPKDHVNHVGLNKDFSSVVFQVGQLVEMGMKDHINAEKGRLRKLPNVVRLLNIAGYKNLDDKLKEIERRIKAGPKNTREWHAIAMDMLDGGEVIFNAYTDFCVSLDENRQERKGRKQIEKNLEKLDKKLIREIRAVSGYHANLNEKQWKHRVTDALGVAEGTVKMMSILGIHNLYVTPREIDFDRIPGSYHAQVKKAIKILEALENDSKPNLKRWQGLQKRMAEINEQIKRLVNRESALGKKRHRCAQSPEPFGVFGLGGMQETHGTVNSEDPDYYDEVPQIARPLPYQCSWVDPERGRGPGVVMALKDLEGRIKDFIDVGMQRLQAYAHAERAAGIVDDPAQKKRFIMIASAAKEMNAILAEWTDVLEKIISLRRDLGEATGTELRAALDLRRCNIPNTSIERAAHRGDEKAVYSEILKKLNRSGEGFEGDHYTAVVSGQSKKEAEEKAYASAISTFVGREIKRPRVWKPKGGRHFIVSFGKLDVFVEKIVSVKMPNSHGMCGIVARLATRADRKPSASTASKAAKPLPKKVQKVQKQKKRGKKSKKTK